MNVKQQHGLYLLGGVVLIAAALLVSFPSGSQPHRQATLTNETTAVDFITTSGTVTVTAELARSPDALRQGLMYRESLEETQGMLFVFSRESNLTFWMKNTLIPLDMIFISDEKEVVHIQKDAQPCEQDPCPLYPSAFPARYVVEVKSGFTDQRGIAVGDSVAFNLG